MGEIPTVKIKRPDSKSGFAVINEADFDADKHELFDASAAQRSTARDEASETESMPKKRGRPKKAVASGD